MLALLHEAGVPAGLVYEPGDMLADLHFQARESIVRVPDREFEDVVMPAVAPRLSATPGQVRWTGPRLGEHTESVLTEVLGLSAQEVRDLQQAGVV